MPRSDGRPVLAIGLDAAQGPFVREMIDRGELPALAGLLERGSWSRVKSTADIGSATVWPTFASGSMPWRDGYQPEWWWSPDEMRLVKGRGAGFVPFWRDLDRSGLASGVVDMPYLDPAPLAHGFELSEWGSHERATGHIGSWPPELAERVLRDVGKHPYANEPPQDPDGMPTGLLTRIVEGSLRGIRMRGELGRRLLREDDPDMLLLVFNELHHVGHLLWHTAEPDSPVYAGKTPPEVRPTLPELYREVDAQISALAAAAGGEPRFVVFSLHGMQPGYGIPAFLEEVLEHERIGRRADWRSGPASQRWRSAFGTLKRRAPRPARRLYNRFAAPGMTRALAAPTLVPPWDWPHTRAFTLYSDQHAWLRVNLRGRERDGTVARSDYESTCRELEDLLGALTDEAGNKLIEKVIRIYERAASPPAHLPDLVAHWTSAAYADPLRVAGMPIESSPTSRRLMGRHDLDGFCISAGNGPVADEIAAAELHRLLHP
jgi:predicted AlkP superfamily phosphohydrolase/phosphomutase